MKNFTFTFDIEDHRHNKKSGENNIERNCYTILEWLESKNIRATFFIISKIAKKFPLLINDISSNNHEIGSHSYDHVSLIKESPESFLHKERKSKDILENLIGKKILGFRAPFFSINENTLWFSDVLTELGFVYSSSVIPKKYKKFGINNIPQNAFKWKSGLLELPMVLGSIKGYQFPCIGGIYLKLLPVDFIKRCLPNDGVFWTYLHPYDIDFKEPFTKIHGTNLFESYLLWIKRKGLLQKSEKLIENYKLLTFSKRISEGEFNSINL